MRARNLEAASLPYSEKIGLLFRVLISNLRVQKAITSITQPMLIHILNFMMILGQETDSLPAKMSTVNMSIRSPWIIIPLIFKSLNFSAKLVLFWVICMLIRILIIIPARRTPPFIFRDQIGIS